MLDAGGAAPFSKGLARYRDWFDGVDYRTLDVSEAARPDIVADLHALPFEDASVDAFVCRSVLEHVRSPETVVAEMQRCLKPGGQVLITVPSVYPYHARTGAYSYPDCWRFFEDGLQILLGGFSDVEVARSGGPATIAMHFLPPLNARARYLLPITDRIDTVLERRRPRHNSAVLSCWASK